MTLLKRIIPKALVSLFDRPLPAATEHEKQAIEQLRSTFRSLGQTSADTASGAMVSWRGRERRLIELVLHDDVREFLRWDIIRNTMFVAHSPHVRHELRYLRSLPDWGGRWSRALLESPVGHPLPYPFYPKSSGSLIDHVYHTARWEAWSGIDIRKDIDFIFEFGGGYGSMCRALFNQGFAGRYWMYDLPVFAALQGYYLAQSGTPLPWLFCPSDIGVIRRELSSMKLENNPRALFLATFSLSETPPGLRQAIANLTKGFGHFLIAYSNKYDGIDNRRYFSAFARERKDLSWRNMAIEHFPGRSYLFGTFGGAK